MDIAFRTRKLGKTFNSESALVRSYGHRMARVIRIRLAVLRNASTLARVPITPPERRHLLSHEWSGHYAVDLVHPFRLILEPTHDPVPRTEDGGIDTSKVTSITIKAVDDYH